MASVLIITHLLCALHLGNAKHPEKPERLSVITTRLEQMQHLSWQGATEINIEHLYRAHDKQFVDNLLSNEMIEETAYIDADTIITPGSIRAAKLASGALIQAVDEVMENKFKHVFCAIRPPGHNATYDQAMGFCLFNNIAIGALYAKEKYKLNRIAIVDFDVHHGNGTEDILKRHQGFLYISSHGSPLYPGTGLSSSNDTILNVPMLSRTGSHEFKRIYTEQILPKLLNFNPELIFISAGFDAHEKDPLGNLRLRANDYQWITERIVDVAEATCNGKIISTLEGGYDLEALANSVEAHVMGLQKDM
ncbi:MAG: histone deacetylase family protein [Alphaproteobacteria bacterium]|nr:histone deacetylase family protein [Alphaproteobacteria bacterium]